MVTYLVQIYNNSREIVNYRTTNKSGGYSSQVTPKTAQYENDDGWVPSSKYYEDVIPYKGDYAYYSVWIENGPSIDIADNNFHLCCNRPTFDSEGKVVGREEREELAIVPNKKYILVVSPSLELEFLEYKEGPFRAGPDGGWISVAILGVLGPIVGESLKAWHL